MLVTSSYDFYTNSLLNKLNEVIESMELRYYADDLFSLLQIERREEQREAIFRAMDICETVGLPVGKHFKWMFRDIDGMLIQDWKISFVAYQLIVINGSPTNDIVAKTQFELLKKGTMD